MSRNGNPRPARRWIAAAVMAATILALLRITDHVPAIAKALDHWYGYVAVVAFFLAVSAALEYSVARAYRGRPAPPG